MREIRLMIAGATPYMRLALDLIMLRQMHADATSSRASLFRIARTICHRPRQGQIQ